MRRSERERLIEYIDGLVRLSLPRGRWGAFCSFRSRLLKTDVATLRAIAAAVPDLVMEAR